MAGYASSKIDFTTLNFGNYSTSEVATEFKWIDGKTIYKKTVVTGAMPNSGSKNVAHGISSIDNLIYAYGNTYNGSGGFRPLPFAGTATNFIGVNVSTTNITFTTASDLTSLTSSWVTLLYTK